MNREEFEDWLARTGKDGCGHRREHLKMLLGRIPPSREFKRAASER